MEVKAVEFVKTGAEVYHKASAGRWSARSGRRWSAAHARRLTFADEWPKPPVLRAAFSILT
jgi:hypothetical protein